MYVTRGGDVVAVVEVDVNGGTESDPLTNGNTLVCITAP